MSNFSALIGLKPNTQDDYWIIKAMLREAYGTDKSNPDDGYTLVPVLPIDQQSEDKGTTILVGMSFCIVIMVVATCCRLAFRLLRPALRWGVDDCVLIPAMVCVPASRLHRYAW